MEEPDAINPTGQERSAGPPRFQKSVLPTNSAVAKGSGLRLIYFRRAGPVQAEESYDLARNNRSAGRADLKIIRARAV